MSNGMRALDSMVLLDKIATQALLFEQELSSGGPIPAPERAIVVYKELSDLVVELGDHLKGMYGAES